MKILITYFLCFISVYVLAQRLPEIDALNRVILNHKDSIIYAHLLPTEKNNGIVASDKYWYYWYAQHDIKETRGGYDGKLLHGWYTEFYASKELKKKGKFKKGIKVGKWKAWYKTGQLREIMFFKKGLVHGKAVSFNEDGSIKAEQKYKKGKMVVQKQSTKKKKNKNDDDQKPKKEKKKNKKEPKIKVRKSIKLFTQPEKST